MLASNVWIEKLAILSREDAFYSVDPLSSKDVAVVVDFHWFTDCHLEAIFNMNTSTVQFLSSITVDGKDIRLTASVSFWTRFSAIFFSTVNHNCLIYQTSYNDFFEVYITETVTLSPNTQMVVLASSTFSMSITWPIVLRPHWSNRLQLIFRYDKS